MIEAAYETSRMLYRLLSSFPTILILVGMMVGCFFIGRLSAENHIKKYHLDDVANAENSKLKNKIHEMSIKIERLSVYEIKIIQMRTILK